jgi:hypothetical protein
MARLDRPLGREFPTIVEELRAEIALLRAEIKAIRSGERSAADSQRRENEKNEAWALKRGEAMREMLDEPQSVPPVNRRPSP